MNAKTPHIMISKHITTPELVKQFLQKLEERKRNRIMSVASKTLLKSGL